MRVPAYGLIAVVSMIFAADMPVGMPLASEILQGGALLVLAWTVWWMLTRTFPAHTAALKDQRDAFLAYLARRDNDQVD